MPYDLDEHQTSIDNMSDTLFERLRMHAIRDNLGDTKCIHDEWIVDGRDPEDGEYVFLFVPNLTLQWVKRKKLNQRCYT